MTLYVCTGQHAITPTADGTVSPGDPPIDLDPEIANPYLTSGDLVLAPTPPSPTITKTPPTKESDQ